MIQLKLKFIVFSLLLVGVNFFAQEKKKIGSLQSVIKGINPNEKTDFWVLVFNQYAKDNEIKVAGAKKEYTPQASGFNVDSNEDGFYYVVYSVKGKTNYITDTENLKKFIAKVDNVNEAIISAILEGYILDYNFADLADNYYEDADNFYLEMGRLMSKECPYQKNYFTITFNKKTGKITNSKDNGKYMEVYNKKCANNPSLLKPQKKEEPKDEPKKTNPKRK